MQDEPLVSDDDEKEETEEEKEELNEDETELSPKPKKTKKSKRKRETEEEIDPKKRAELEMLMIDAEDSKLKHFDIHEIVKDEKMSKKKKRKLKKVDVEDNFKLNMEDCRYMLLCMYSTRVLYVKCIWHFHLLKSFSFCRSGTAFLSEFAVVCVKLCYLINWNHKSFRRNCNVLFLRKTVIFPES